MAVGLIICAIAFKFVDIPMESNSLSTQSSSASATWPLVILIAMIIYVAGYAIGLGNVPWQQSE